MSNLSKEKLDWLKEVGVRVFEHPMKYCIRNWVFSEKYLKETPLENLKRDYGHIRSDGPSYIIEHEV